VIPELIIICFPDSGIDSSSIFKVDQDSVWLERFKNYCVIDARPIEGHILFFFLHFTNFVTSTNCDFFICLMDNLSVTEKRNNLLLLFLKPNEDNCRNHWEHDC